ncbi:MAG TPA: sugar ABC transporter substrate-binding protein [Herbaspirillum sp.]|nr:sugar ABC transporter substrate-binding protein [Herbaspirillum sp.]
MKLKNRIAISVLSLVSGLVFASDQPIIGLITKTEINPYFVKMKEGAQEAAKAKGVRLLTASGKFDGDNASQVAAIENMVAVGAKTILITPNDSKAIVPAIKKAREQGVMVIALDTPTNPREAADALFATDNVKAGILIGQYAKAAFGDRPMKIATLNLSPGKLSGIQRHDGFLQGLGIKEGDASVVCAQDSYGDQAKGQTAMENCLQKNPDINLVYAINEPAAAGAYKALKAAGKEKNVMLVSIDGACEGVRNIKAGFITATSQQYPLKMAVLGVEAGSDYARTGKKVSGYVDTGVTLITDKKQKDIDSKDSNFGLDSCWGRK